jgi:TRAP-type C4-dicarboxylate transport system permease small subunit
LSTFDRLAFQTVKTALRIIGDNAEELIGSFLLMIIFLTMALQVGLRTIFSFPLAWPEELSQFLMVWASLLGAVGALKRVDLVKIGIVEDRLSGPWLKLLQWLQFAIVVWLLATLLVSGADFTSRARLMAASMPITWF